ncbi:MAG TPA: NAD(P)/FAD-dependent oxidoreductase [Thermoflexia bacterium]|nr:NAD(P)/FAD-dependent oxidoreductase [Thermoflexia bacterium]
MKHIIVGSGVAGVTAAQAIVRADPSTEVHLFGAESHPYYRRPQLWELIAGQVEKDALIFRPPDWYAGRGIHLHLGVRATALDPAAHTLALSDDSTVEYDRLLLATGARPFVPPCEGTDKAGVFTLRTMEDALAIKAYAQKVSTAVVVGGGLLGLETARALHAADLDVTVVEFSSHLLPRQLDAEGAEVLRSLLEAQGLRIITGGATEAITGDERADGVRLKDGREVPGELVLFSTGIRSEVTLAQEAGLEVNRGVVVDGHLRTSAADVFAAGDAAEFAGRVYGIIPAAIEQARVAAANMVELGSSTYTGTLASTTLKIAGAELASLGESTVEGGAYTQLRRADVAAGHYRKFVLREGRIVGAILLNDKERARPVTRLIERGVDVSAYADCLLDDDFDLRTLLREV